MFSHAFIVFCHGSFTVIISFFQTSLNCFSLSRGSIGNKHSASKVGIRFVYTLPSTVSTLWDYTWYAIVV
uniref:Putative ovule protein n=1 Tax=Solanum chacoense TaxID=4108 RepID=A0A0V0H7Y1_SOLCH